MSDKLAQNQRWFETVLHYFDVPHIQRTRWENFKDWLNGPCAYHRWRKQHVTGYKWVGNL